MCIIYQGIPPIELKTVTCLCLQEKGFELMKKIAETTDENAKHLVRAAQYNLARAYFQGYGVRQSDEEAERLEKLTCACRSQTNSWLLMPSVVINLRGSI